MSIRRTFECTPRGFRSNGRKIFLSSGEVHYFRIAPSRWKRHLAQLERAGCKAITTYVPWDWHEYREGRFDLTGKADPRRNLVKFIRLAKGMGLFLILKPGPYILAEYSGHGIPHWLTKKHPEIRAHDRNGTPSDNFLITLLHPTFLRYVRRWYKRVNEIVAAHQASSGGNIVMMQVCNEIGVFGWLANEADYSPVLLRFYREFLKRCYKDDISALNRLYKTDYKGFSDVEPSYGYITDRASLLRDLDWHGFWRWYYAEYIKRLKGFIREDGVEIQLYHNVPGWQFGRATPYLMNLSMYEDFVDEMPDVMLAVDHLPENMTYRNFHDAAVCDQAAFSIQKRRFPVYIAEMQAGSREHGVVTYPAELELFYKSVLMHGVKGFNYYMFSQGLNPPGKGFFGPTFYWQAPLNNDGSKNKVYGTIKRMNRFADTHIGYLSGTDASAAIGFLYYRPYYRWELLRGMELNSRIPRYDMRALNQNIFFDGMVKTAEILNMDFRIEDLISTAAEGLSAYKQLWVISLDQMDLDTQSKLAAYVNGGGHLIMMPTIPQYDLAFRRRSLLSRRFGIRKASSSHIGDPRISFMGIEDIFVMNPIDILEADAPAKVIARTPDGGICGVERRVGRGRVTVLGTAFGHQVAEHITGYRKLLDMAGSGRAASSSSRYMSVSQVSAGDYGYLFVSNHHNMTIEGKVTFTDVLSRRPVTFPRNMELTLPPLYGFITPLNLPLGTTEERILYCTADILRMNASKSRIRLNIYSAIGLNNEIGLVARRMPARVSINGRKASFLRVRDRITLNFKASRRENEVEILF